MTRRIVSTPAALVLLVLAVGVGAGWRWWTRPGAAAAPQPRAAATAAVVRADLAARTQVAGTLGFAADWPVVHSGGSEVLTWAPPPGAVIPRGQRLYEVDGHAVWLLYGTRPAWRDLSVGMPPGEDVRQLERNLVALGFTGLTVDTRFTTATAAAVRRWQRRHGLVQTGRVPVGTVVFEPQAVRVVAVPTPVGGRVGGGPVLRVSSTRRVVTVALPTARQASVRVGGTVVVTLPDGRHTPGMVAAVGRVAQSGQPQLGGGLGDATVTVTVTLRRPRAAGGLDQAPVQVAITTAARRGVLAVPVTALTAADGGGYEVDVVQGAARRRVAVLPGLFDELSGLVEVTGGGLAAGMRVEVPQR
jgi:peptidoglycan hydrolase-like protein with peptidoglycan-binding domain